MVFKKSSTRDEDAGSDTWNVADGFTKLKILRHLVQLDRYENIATFGTDEMDELNLDDFNISKKRIEGLNRYLFTLKQLIGNVKFAIKKEDKDKIKRFEETLAFIEENLDKLYTTETNYVTHEDNLKINEPFFKKVLEYLHEIKDELNYPLNRANLIFRESDAVNLSDMMSEFVDGG